MIERLVEARRNIRFLKNLFRGRILRESEHIEENILEALRPYATAEKIRVFGINTDGRVLMLATDYNGLVRQAEFSKEFIDLDKVGVHYQRFSGMRDSRHYFDVNYDNLKVMIKISEDRGYNFN